MLDMGIIKLEVNLAELKEAITSIADTRRKLFDLITHEVKVAASSAIEHAINAEITIFLGKSSEKGNKRNGYEIREYYAGQPWPLNHTEGKCADCVAERSRFFNMTFN